MKLVEYWKSAYKLLSVQLAGLLVVWAGLPDEQKSAVLALLHVPQDIVTGALALLVIAGRLITQDTVTQKKD